jgi:hypothetical protein
MIYKEDNNFPVEPGQVLFTTADLRTLKFLHASIREHLNLGHTVWPWKDLMGLSTLSLQTWIHWSVLQDAKLVLVCQSTSSAGAEWNENCWVHCPDAASQIIVVWRDEVELQIYLNTVTFCQSWKCKFLYKCGSILDTDSSFSQTIQYTLLWILNGIWMKII